MSPKFTAFPSYEGLRGGRTGSTEANHANCSSNPQLDTLLKDSGMLANGEKPLEGGTFTGVGHDRQFRTLKVGNLQRGR